MSNRIFMNVHQVRDLADKLDNYNDIQTVKLDKYYSVVMQMVDEMEGKAKHGLDTASNHINLESKDIIRRMKGFEIVYKFTGESRDLVDKEGAEAAKSGEIGSVRKV